MVDVQTEIHIDAPRSKVAAYASNPDNAPEWYANIRSVEWKTTPPLQVGSRILFTAKFAGRELSYTYVVAEFTPEKVLVMETADGPFPMKTIYSWHAESPRSTRMILRNLGKPSGFSWLLSPLMSVMVRSANKKDLRNLKSILEHQEI